MPESKQKRSFFGLFGRSKSTEPAEQEHVPSAVEEPIVDESALAEETNVSETLSAEEPETKGSWFGRLKKGLAKTRSSFSSGLSSLLLGKKSIDDELLEELETQLLISDVGVDTTQKIVGELTDKVERKELNDGDVLFASLKQLLFDTVKPVEQPLDVTRAQGPFVILVVGVNGAGKTTTIGKLAKHLQLAGKSVMLAAGDTFRAAAVEQLQVWGERNDIPVIAQHEGADSASVIFDAFQSAQAKNIDVLIADTAGRLQNKAHLMEELKKVKRVMGKIDDSAPHEVLLVLDAGIGQNAISQTELFDQAVGVTGLALTKLDGTAKGGVVFALADRFKLPIRCIGIGESIDDLRPFEADAFVDALLATED